MEIKIENGALTEAPVYCGHKRGKNWFAIITLDPKAPAGLARNFQDKAHGDYYYMATGIKQYDAIEFGGDYYSGGGSKDARRWYGVVTSITDESVTMEQAENGRAAVKRAAELKTQAEEISLTPADESTLWLQDLKDLLARAPEGSKELADKIKSLL